MQLLAQRHIPRLDLADRQRVLVAIADINYAYDLWLPMTPRDYAVAPVGNPFLNPGFEGGTSNWAQGSTHGWPIIISSGWPPGVAPHGGGWLGWLGGDDDDTSYIQQRVRVPAGAPHLAYWHWIASEDLCDFDFARVRVDGTLVHSYTLCDATSTGGWVRKFVDLSAWRGQVVTVRLLVETDGSLNSNLFVDDFSFVAVPVAAAEEPATDFADYAERRSAAD